MYFPKGSRPFVVPFLVFLLFLLLRSPFDWIFKGHGSLWVAEPQYWIFPLQTVVCGILVARFWRAYGFQPPRKLLGTFLVAILVLAIWVSPQEIFRVAPRTEGFDPSVFAGNPALYWGNLLFRFVRLVVVVPLVEEVFWRGFLLRFLINDDFRKVPVGTFTWSSFLWTSVLFGFEHAGPDLVAAIITGALFNVVAYRTKSLASCVLVHALVNLLLGFYILATGQWGFW